MKPDDCIVKKGHTHYRQVIAITFVRHFDDKELEYCSNLQTGLSRRACNGKIFNKRIRVIILTWDFKFSRMTNFKKIVLYRHGR